MKLASLACALILAVVVHAPAQSIEVPYRGLDYSMVSRDGLTVMIAPLDLSVMQYSAAHVWITNGSQRTIHLEPQFFSARIRTTRQPDASGYTALSDSVVVREVMDHARFGDILSVVKAYERNLYGFKNPDAINFYQMRKQVAMAEGGSRRTRAAAMVSAIVLPKTDIPPGEFREGTVFFLTGDKKSRFLEFSVRLGGLSFAFRPPAGSRQ